MGRRLEVHGEEGGGAWGGGWRCMGRRVEVHGEEVEVHGEEGGGSI